MKFKDFLEKNLVRKGEPDTQLCKSLIKMSSKKLKFLENQEIDEVSAATIMTTYYEALREILEAIASQEGYKFYSHEAYTFFLKEKEEDLIATKFDRFRKIRNNINYYGKDIDPNSVKENKKEIKSIIRQLKEKYLTAVT